MFRFLSLSIFALALTFSVQAAEPFKASDIRIDGLKRVSSGSIFDVLTIQPGDLVTNADISLATRALFGTGFFDQSKLVRKASASYPSNRKARSISDRD